MRILLESSREWLRQDKSFVQGLFYDKDNILYESSGLYGQSAIRKLELDGAYGVIRTRKITSVPKEIFAEGLTGSCPSQHKRMKRSLQIQSGTCSRILR